MSTAIPTLIEKCKGAMLAVAIGDALGWPNEPRAKNRVKKPKIVDYFVGWTRSSNNPRWHDEKILPGEYSDDTQMILSVARSIIAGDWEKYFSEKELPFWLNYERGGGGALLKAAKFYSQSKERLWQSSYANDYFNAGGNGAAMRILPHVIAAAKTPSIPTLMADVHKDTLITHGHPRALLGTACYAFALEYLLRKETVLEYGELVDAVINGQNEWGADLDPNVFGKWLESAECHPDYHFLTEWDNTRIRMVKRLEYVKDSLKKGLILDDTKVLMELECFGKANGAGDVAALAAVYLASRYANNPVLGIKIPAYSFGADTDTIASMTGGLAGMLNGADWIPGEWKAVQDYDCLIQMTELLLAENKKEAAKAEVMEAKAQDTGWLATPIGKMHLVDSQSVLNGKNGVVIIKKWQTVLGQTLYTKNFQPRDDAPQISTDESNSANTWIRPRERQFTLTAEVIKTLLEKPEFKSNISVGKAFKVIRAFIEKDEPVAETAKQFGLDEEMATLIKMCVK